MADPGRLTAPPGGARCGLRITLSDGPDAVVNGGFSLESLLEFRWQVTVGDMMLDPEEISQLAEAKRPLVRLRGRWVVVDPELLARLRRSPKITAAAGVELLPGAGELQPRCSCPDRADPCKHAAAVCYLVAPALDADPFALFALRGLERDALIAAVRRARSASNRSPRVLSGVGGSTVGSMARAPEPGIGAQQVWLDWPQRLEAGTARLPGAAPLAKRAVQPRALPPPADAEGQEVDVVDLARLATDAAARAWNMLAGLGDSGLTLDAGHDMARRAAAALARGTDAFEQLAPAAWSPPAGLLAETAAQMQSESAGELRLRVGGDRLTLVGHRAALHPGPDGRWYRLERRHGHLELTRPPAEDPVDLLSD